MLAATAKIINTGKASPTISERCLRKFIDLIYHACATADGTFEQKKITRQVSAIQLTCRVLVLVLSANGEFC